VDVTLPAIAADRRRLLHGARSALAHLSIDSPTHMVLNTEPAAHRRCYRSMGQTDGHPTVTIHAALHTMTAASIINVRINDIVE